MVVKIKTAFTFIFMSSGVLVALKYQSERSSSRLRSSNSVMEPNKLFCSRRQDVISADKRMKCNQCNYASSYMGHLRVHMRTHENTKSRQSNLSSSESSSEENEKTYKCNPCNYWCTGAERMRKHMKSHNTVVEKSFYCTLCHYTSANARDMKAHTLAHNDTVERSFYCTLCKYKSACARDMRTHTLAHKSLFENQEPSVSERWKGKHTGRIGGEKPNKCNRCNYASSCGSNLKAHMFFYHFCSFISSLIH